MTVFDVATVAALGKGKLCDLLNAAVTAATVGQALYGVEVHYEYNGNMGPRSIYGGGWSSANEEAAEERGALISELVTSTWYVRVAAGPPAVSVRQTDTDAAAILAAIRALMLSHPTLDGQITWIDMPRTQGDYEVHNDSTITLLGFTTRFGAFIGHT